MKVPNNSSLRDASPGPAAASGGGIERRRRVAICSLSDKQVSAAITDMHDEAAHDWTVEELAQRVGMSRSTFALKFKGTVGGLADGAPHTLANAPGWGQNGEIPEIPLPKSLNRSATKPQAPSPKLLRKSWETRRGNIAVDTIRFPCR